MSISLLTQLFDVKMAVRIIDYDTLSHVNVIAILFFIVVFHSEYGPLL